MPNAEFLETYPLYRKMRSDVPNVLGAIPKTPINMDCGTCRTVTTFVMENDYWDPWKNPSRLSSGQIVLAKYHCARCTSFKRAFAILISDDLTSVMKVGQYPPWSVKPDASVAGLLGDHRSWLEKGLICESQGYGIGAFAYYRRIVEDIIDDLLNQVGDLVTGPEHEAFAEALERTKTSRVAAEKIAIVKDLLPPILRPQGANPLSVLHSTLSEGLHAETDERCLELAMAVRSATAFLASQIAGSQSASNAFTDSIRKLLGKGAGRPPTSEAEGN